MFLPRQPEVFKRPSEPEGFTAAWARFKRDLWGVVLQVLWVGVSIGRLGHSTVNLGPEFVGTFLGLENPRRHTLGKWAVLMLLLFMVAALGRGLWFVVDQLRAWG